MSKSRTTVASTESIDASGGDAGGSVPLAAVPASATPPGVGPLPRDYEAAVAELESLVQRMEDGRLALEESVTAYQRGVELVRYCREQLGAVEQKVRVLEAGLLQPFEADVPGDEPGDRDET